MSISREDVLRVAQLAHLELAPEEVETYRGQLDEILAYIGKLQELDVSGVEPMTQMRPQASDGAAAAGAEPELRDDVVAPCNVASAALAQAPDAVKPFFRVPKVIER
jgi:aspartyl-tRNA(Asn)/glutamyl-tRNA(Gln) amidotransferase subunit C